MKIECYERPTTLDDAYLLLMSHQKATLMAGGMFLRLQDRKIPIAIDLSGLGLDFIAVDGGKDILIGPMVTLRSLELDDRLPIALRQSVQQIGGVALRNMATLGGSIMGRYPFSDVTTALLALGAELSFYKNGTMDVADFLAHGADERDILVSVRIKGNDTRRQAYKSIRPVHTDFPLLNMAVVIEDDDDDAEGILVIGARPHRSKGLHLDTSTLHGLLTNATSRMSLLDTFDFDTDMRASADFRKDLARKLLDDIVAEFFGTTGVKG